MPAAVVQTSVIDARSVAGRIGWARTWVPVYSREVRHARRVEVRTFPLFSRYFFAWIEPDDVGKIKKVRGVVDVLRKAGSTEPSYVREDALACLGDVAQPEYKIGDMLRIAHGRWAGLEGLFSRREDERVFLLISILGKDIEVPVLSNEVSIRL
jgi:hypothetical protein